MDGESDLSPSEMSNGLFNELTNWGSIAMLHEVSFERQNGFVFGNKPKSDRLAIANKEQYVLLSHLQTDSFEACSNVE
jgi:hypothetical protein